MTAKRYQDLDAWRLSNELKGEVYKLIATSPVAEDRRFCDQLRDSASGAPRNLAEGFGRFAHREFAQFARFARASLLETHNHICDAQDRGYVTPREAERLKALADRATGATTRLWQYLVATPTPRPRTRART